MAITHRLKCEIKLLNAQAAPSPGTWNQQVDENRTEVQHQAGTRSTPLEQVTSRPAVYATLDVSPRFQMTIPTPPLVILVPQQVPASSHRQAAYYKERLSRLLEGKTEPPPDPGRPAAQRRAQRWSFLTT